LDRLPTLGIPIRPPELEGNPQCLPKLMTPQLQPGTSLQPPEPRSPSNTRRSTTDTRTPSPGSAGRSDLADHDRRRHWEWRIRRQLAQAEHWMQTRVRHPDGGERTVTETQADEEEQRRQINRETALGSLKHRRLPRWQHW